MFATKAVGRGWKVNSVQVVFPLLTVAAMYVVAVHLLAALDQPLWLDETWSAMIATRLSWHDFWREAWLDCNPPLYYIFLSGWVHIFGDSNFALRLPSALFVIGAAVTPLLCRSRELDRPAAQTWALLLISWQPALFVMTDARGYGLNFFLSVLSCLAMLRLLKKPKLSWAFVWVGLNTLMFLTHYYAAVLVIGQAVIVAYRHRLALLQFWPAALAAIPGLGWLIYHYPRLQDYARPDVVWYEPLDLESAIQLLSYVLGAARPLTSLVMMILGMVALRAYFRRNTPDKPPLGQPDDLLLVASSAGIAFALAMIVGAVQPSLAARYLIPLVPPAMLALAVGLRRSPWPEAMTAALILAMLLPGFDKNVAVREMNTRSAYGFQEGSEFVGRYKPDTLVFLWDHPASKILDSGSLSTLGSYFLARSGAHLKSQTLVVPETADANAMLRQAAVGERPAIIWLYNTARRSAARDHPSSFQNDGSWSCSGQELSRRDEGRRSKGSEPSRASRLGAIACVKIGETK